MIADYDGEEKPMFMINGKKKNINSVILIIIRIIIISFIYRIIIFLFSIYHGHELLLSLRAFCSFPEARGRTAIFQKWKNDLNAKCTILSFWRANLTFSSVVYRTSRAFSQIRKKYSLIKSLSRFHPFHFSSSLRFSETAATGKS